MTTPRATAPRPVTRRDASFALDPYRVEDCTWTREQILRARGYPVARRRTRRRSSAVCRETS
jgi:hypothetical protein